MKNRTIYRLTTQDIQSVAKAELKRQLSDEEIDQIVERIADNINWYDAIHDAIFDFETGKEMINNPKVSP